MKEAVFDHSVRQNVYEERQNQLRWQVKIGEDPISNQSRFNILEERNNAQNHYMFKIRGDPVIDDEFIRPKSSLTYRRTIRDIEMQPPKDATFDTYSNDMWAVRHAALDKFVQAARKIVIRNRAMKKLHSLQTYMMDWNKKKFNPNADADIVENLERIDTTIVHGDIPDFTAEKVKRFKFPTYVPPNVKDDMAPDALGSVPYMPTDVLVKRDEPYFGLKVPQFYKLQGYRGHNGHDASCGYVPTKRVRSLRTGAEDEVIHLPSDAVVGTNAAAAGLDTDDEDVAAAVTAPAATTAAAVVASDSNMLPSQRQQPVTLTPPDALFKSPEYPSLQIVNPAPGLQVFQAPMPYAEVDYDYHLCPLPRYPRTDHATNKHSVTQRKFLDREDTIRGIMTWKKFPSQGLTSLANHPTLTSVWVPRWDDCFSQELLPEKVPPLFDNLAADDAENVMEEDESDAEMGAVSLKPEMVSAQFDLIDPSTPSEDHKTPQPVNQEDLNAAKSVPEEDNDDGDPDMFPYGNRMPNTNIPVGSHGPVAREKREEELEYFITKKYNRLGSKVKGKVSNLSSLLSDQEMVLK